MAGVLENLRRINAPPPPEESAALRVAVLVSVMAGAIAVINQDVGGSGLRAATLIGIPGGFLYSHRFRHRPSFWLKLALAGALLLAFGRFLASVSHIENYSVADVQIPLAELFLWVQILHSIDVPARRDLMFSLASSLTLIAVAGVLSIATSYGLKLAVWAVASLASLVLIHRSELSDLRSLQRATAGPSRRRVAWGTVRVVALLTLVIGVLATAVFSVAPSASPRPAGCPTRP